jgi:hypothetical protein
VYVDLDAAGDWLGAGRWNSIDCGSRVSHARVFPRVSYGAATIVTLRLVSGLWCRYPKAGDVSRVTVWYWLDE